MNQTKHLESNTTGDEFWDVALEAHGNTIWQTNNNDDTDSDCSDEHSWIATRRTNYRLDCPSSPPFHVYLSPLAPKSGIWSPLGSDIWYGSALLTAFLFTDQQNQTAERLHRFLNANITISETTNEFSVLELGSGAVGLTGLAVGWMLRYHPIITLQQNQKCRIRVTLTDNDEEVLRQLKQNVDYNVDTWHEDSSWASENENNTHYFVDYLDWNEPSPFLSHLVIGSELVYNDETAQACAEVVCSLVDQNPHLLIVIIQVSDRDGWGNVFIPRLQSQDKLVVVESVLSDPLLHERASKLVRFGGTLHRDDYSLCYIYSNQTLF